MRNVKSFRWTSLTPIGIAIFVAAAVMGALPAAAASGHGNQSAGHSHHGGASAAWRDDFSGTQADTSRWVIASGQAPGYIPGLHIGYYDPTHAKIVSSGGNSYLQMLLTQENGTVDGASGVISRGALLYTKNTYGYGAYTWRMRMSSTSATPAGDGVPESGSVSAGFIYVNNSQTEIDFEYSALNPDTLYLVNWKNNSPSTGPTVNEETFTALEPFDSTSDFHTYEFVWTRSSISYYVDGVLQAVHTTNIPKAPAYFMINHWGTDNANWGGASTVGVNRYCYVDWVSYTPQ